ncbi:methyltransferase domain-containing protein, partial [Lacticaseibacillus rhamnosus]
MWPLRSCGRCACGAARARPRRPRGHPRTGRRARTQRPSLRVLKGKCRLVIGMDVNESARDNPFVNEFRPLVEGNWPAEYRSADFVVCDFVIEHLPEPASFFQVCRRVLRAV